MNGHCIITEKFTTNKMSANSSWRLYFLALSCVAQVALTCTVLCVRETGSLYSPFSEPSEAFDKTIG